MRPEAFDTIEILGSSEILPLASRQSNSQLQSLTGLAVMGGLAALIVLPQILLAVSAIALPDVRDAIAQRPLVAIELAVALVFWTALLCWPVRRFLSRVQRERQTEISAHAVEVTETRMFGRETWREPVSAYSGLVHFIRSSLSGIRHELVLAHPQAARCVVVLAADRMSEADVQRMAALLHLPVLDAAQVFGWAAKNRAAAASVEDALSPRQHHEIAIAA